MKKLLGIIFVLFGCICSGSAHSDDTDALGMPSAKIEPNVMIIFDTSASMATRDVPVKPYQGDTDYTIGDAGYEKTAVYRWKRSSDGGSWSKLIDWNAMDRSCVGQAIFEELKDNGHAWVRINTASPHNCGGEYNELDLRMGNFLNFESRHLPGLMHKRLDVAKEVVQHFIEKHPHVRFGLMQFENNSPTSSGDTLGGMLTPNGDINNNPTTAQLLSDISTFTANSYSPLAEVLAEAGLYFSGERSWFNNVTYLSPIDVKCRPSYIILMTDGDSTADQDARLSQQNAYINNGTIGDYDQDGREPGTSSLGGSDYLDDVAAFLLNEDLMPDMGTDGDAYEKQHIVTHTIGFKNSHQLLQDTAANGGGLFFTADSADSLTAAFDRIMGNIENDSQVFAAPSVSISKLNGVYAGNHLYIGLFQPDRITGNWKGNLKKYAIHPETGLLLDQNKVTATDGDGNFKHSAMSFWSTEADGNNVAKGGAGAKLLLNTSRQLYTYIDGDGADLRLKADDNAFTTENDALTHTMLDVANDEERNTVIRDIHGIGKDWIMADVVHSEPAIVTYDTNNDNKIDDNDDSVIYVGTNGGMLQAFLDSTGEELWGFIPPHQLNRLKMLSDNRFEHTYFMDGTPVIFEDDESHEKMLIIGERRGGSHYYALNISDPTDPKWKYSINDDILGGDEVEKLGQSWGLPQLIKIATGEDTTADVLLFPGGYDNNNQDLVTPAAIDTKGRAVFSVAADSGELGSFKFYYDEATGNSLDMEHCIVDIVGVDTSGDGIVNSIYAPDLGGNIFAFTDGDADGVWKRLRLINVSRDEHHRKIFYAPDVVRITADPDPDDDVDKQRDGEMIFFGTGDRAHPAETKHQNRFYAVKNYWWKTDFNTIESDGELHDATDNPILQAATLADQQNAYIEIKNKLGWFINLESNGEKIISSPVVFNGAVYFTTYIPPVLGNDAATETDEKCNGENIAGGEARLYGLNYKDGTAVHDDWSAAKEYDPVAQKEIKSGGKLDRYKKIGNSIPTAPVIAIRDGIAMLYVGVGRKMFAISPQQAVEMNMYYWREIMN